MFKKKKKSHSGLQLCGMCEMLGLKLSCHTQNQFCHNGATSQHTAHTLPRTHPHRNLMTLLL